MSTYDNIDKPSSGLDFKAVDGSFHDTADKADAASSKYKSEFMREMHDEVDNPEEPINKGFDDKSLIDDKSPENPIIESKKL